MGRKSRSKKERSNTEQQWELRAKAPAAPSAFLRLALVFAVLVILFELVVEKMVDMTLLQLATASVTTALLQFTGMEVLTNGINMTLPNVQWEIIRECTAIRAQVVFIAFVLAYPASIRAKSLAVAAGVPFLFAANIIRLVALGWLTYFSPALASYCHDFVWQMGFLFLVIGMWLAWIEWVVNGEKQPAVPA